MGQTGSMLCQLDALEDPGACSFTLDAGEWPLRGFVVRQGDRVAAYVNRCPHAGHPLNWGPDQFLSRDQRHILCGSHGALFELLSGECVSGPCTGRALTALPVRIENGAVLLEGDVAELVHRYA